MKRVNFLCLVLLGLFFTACHSNQLKLRASYGRTGKVNFPAYAATTMYETLFDEWYITGYGAVLKALGNNCLLYTSRCV